MSYSPQVSLALVNGKIITVDEQCSIAEAVAIKGNRIVKVGTDDEIQAIVGPSTNVIDLGGKVVLPGFIDSHVHAFGAGRLKVQEGREVDIKYSDSIEEVLDLIRERTEVTPEGEWIIGWGYMWSRFKEKRVPTARELDEAAPKNPVLLKFSAYGAANSMALRIAGVTKDSKPAYGELEFDPETGEPTGVLKGGAAVRLVSDHVPPWELSPVEAVERACKQWSEWGITTVHQAGSMPRDTASAQTLRSEGRLTVRMRLYVSNMAPNLDNMDHVIALGLRNGFGDDVIRLCGVKLALDSMGTMGTAATYEPCTGNPDSLGILLMEPETLNEYIVKAHKSGLQTATHSIGDRAIDINLDAIEAALKERPVEDHRHRIEHCTHCGPRQLRRIRDLGVHPAESNYVWNFGDAYKYQFGEERSEWLYPFRSFKEHGIIASANSDYGGGPWHGNPILGIYAMVTRKTEGGDTIGFNQAVDVMDAIRAYTINGAYGAFDETMLGTIEEGKLADIIVLSDDILEIEPQRIKETKVTLTIMDGKIVYQREI